MWSKRQRLVLLMLLGVTGAGSAGFIAARLAYSDADRQVNKSPSSALHVLRSNGVDAPRGMALIPGGQFLMGSDRKLSQLNERPVHWVRVSAFWMDVTHVTNDQFARFVDATGYVTTAEKKPDWQTLRVQLPAGTPKPDDAELVAGAMVFVGSAAPVPLDNPARWWAFVPGANWRHPEGPTSSIEGRGAHPVVQVSYEDALAYAHWIGKRLPTEAEWEFAARGGLAQATYAWGNEPVIDGKLPANVWRVAERTFPVVDASSRDAVATSPVGSFPANPYGLFDVTGNAWQWVSDWYRSDYFQIQARQSAGGLIVNPRGPVDSYDDSGDGAPVTAPKRVIRGGSFLCSEEYCQSFRPSARRGADPYSPMSHVGFRLVKDL
jgi:formylglycine-generating enzyme required for sulfatase activity